MRRRPAPVKKIPVPWNENPRAVYHTPAPPPAPEVSLDISDDDTLSLDDLLSKQMLALQRITKTLVIAATKGASKDEIQSLATVIKITLELKAQEKDLLGQMSDEELEKIANKDAD